MLNSIDIIVADVIKYNEMSHRDVAALESQLNNIIAELQIFVMAHARDLDGEEESELRSILKRAVIRKNAYESMKAEKIVLDNDWQLDE